MPVVSSPPPLVGRAAEREAITAALQSIRSRPGGIVAIAGEPGIGKSRLLAHLIESADGCEVLDARASEFEADLPYAMFADALGEAPPALDRHSAHRALREQLERRAAARPLVLCLDDVHWADPASLDALAALVRRPPAAAVLLALTAREGQLPAALATALAGSPPATSPPLCSTPARRRRSTPAPTSTPRVSPAGAWARRSPPRATLNAPCRRCCSRSAARSWRPSCPSTARPPRRRWSRRSWRAAT
jgi:hypothetical protein